MGWFMVGIVNRMGCTLLRNGDIADKWGTFETLRPLFQRKKEKKRNENEINI